MYCPSPGPVRLTTHTHTQSLHPSSFVRCGSVGGIQFIELLNLRAPEVSTAGTDSVTDCITSEMSCSFSSPLLLLLFCWSSIWHRSCCLTHQNPVRKCSSASGLSGSGARRCKPHTHTPRRDGGNICTAVCVTVFRQICVLSGRIIIMQYQCIRGSETKLSPLTTCSAEQVG